MPDTQRTRDDRARLIVEAVSARTRLGREMKARIDVGRDVTRDQIDRLAYVNAILDRLGAFPG